MEQEKAAGQVDGMKDVVKEDPRKPMEYPHNPIDAFSNGVLLDLRVRIAVDFLQKSPLLAEVGKAVMLQAGKTPVVAGDMAPGLLDRLKKMPLGPLTPMPTEEAGVKASDVPTWCARFALELADALMQESEKRGWVAPLPTFGDLEDVLKGHAKRTGAFSFYQQLGGGEAQQEYARKQAAEGPRVQAAPANAIPRAPGPKLNS